MFFFKFIILCVCSFELFSSLAFQPTMVDAQLDQLYKDMSADDVSSLGYNEGAESAASADPDLRISPGGQQQCSEGLLSPPCNEPMSMSESSTSTSQQGGGQGECTNEVVRLIFVLERIH